MLEHRPINSGHHIVAFRIMLVCQLGARNSQGSDLVTSCVGYSLHTDLLVDRGRLSGSSMFPSVQKNANSDMDSFLSFSVTVININRATRRPKWHTSVTTSYLRLMA